MSLLLFAGALAAIVIIAMAINRLTGTRALYLDALALQPGEQELWCDDGADFAIRPRLGQALVMSYPRLRRHTVLWTSRRVIVAQRPLGSQRPMVTHQLYFTTAAGGESPQAAGEAFGGFYGRGFVTLEAVGRAFGEADGKPCLRITPAEISGGQLNVAEALLFSDSLDALRGKLPP